MTTNTTGYKAAVCIFMYGGNDSFNWVVPTTAAKYAEYAAARGSLAIPQTSLLPLNGVASDGNSYGLHPNCPELAALFNTGKGAVVSNVGALLQPTTAAQVIAGTATLPPQLFSHIDQQHYWMTGNMQAGWAGRIADQLVANGYTPKLDVCVNAGCGGNQAYWQAGVNTSAYVLSSSGATPINSINDGAIGIAVNALYSQATIDPNPLVQTYGAVANSTLSKLGVVQAAIASAGNFTTAKFNSDGLGSQLQITAKLIKAHATLGDTRQLFFIGYNGFDTHQGELSTQQTLLTELSQQLNQFYNALVESGTNSDVVFFTNSEFGRTLLSNNGGSDHGWGGHSMVFGDSVKGGFYGTMPSLVIGGSDDMGEGRVVPTTSTDQYSATIANWFGADYTTLFPNLANFSPPVLGFL